MENARLDRASEPASLEAEAPPGFELSRTKVYVRIEWSWAQRVEPFAVIFILLYAATAVLFAKVPIGCLATPLLGIGALLLAYQTLAGALNHTTILLAHGQCSVRHGPVPCPGGSVIPFEHVRGVHCRQRRVRGAGLFRASRIEHEVYIVLPTEREKRLVGMLPSAAHAEFLKRELEQQTGFPPS